MWARRRLCRFRVRLLGERRRAQEEEEEGLLAQLLVVLLAQLLVLVEVVVVEGRRAWRLLRIVPRWISSRR